MASPARIARAADARSPARSTMLRLGEAATCSTKAREVSDRSSSTTTTPSPRITGWLKAALRTTKANSGTPKTKIRATRAGEDKEEPHAVVHQPSPCRGGGEPEAGLRRAPHLRSRQSRYALMPGRN